MMMMMDNELIGKVQTTATISDVPVEVLTLVLVRLSAKDILACVCVKKSWRSLIKTRMFITLHSNYHQNISSNKYLFFWNICTEAYEIRVDDIECENYLTLKYPPGLSHLNIFQLVSNGLICLFDYPSTTIHLWNPVIRKYKTLPHSPCPPYSHKRTQWEAIAFGFVPQTNDYLVVYIVKYGLKNKPRTHPIITCVYSLNTNSWRKITHDDDSIPIDDISQRNSVFVNGVAVWDGRSNYARGERVLVCFDTKTEMLRVILLPEWLETHRLRFPVVHAFDQSIAYFAVDDNYVYFGMLVLKGDPMNEYLWEMKMMVELHKDVILPVVMGVRNNGEPLLLKCSDDLISYNLDSHKSYDFCKSWYSWKPNTWDDVCGKPLIMLKPFAESLGLLDNDSTQY